MIKLINNGSKKVFSMMVLSLIVVAADIAWAATDIKTAAGSACRRTNEISESESRSAIMLNGTMSAIGGSADVVCPVFRDHASFTLPVVKVYAHDLNPTEDVTCSLYIYQSGWLFVNGTTVSSNGTPGDIILTLARDADTQIEANHEMGALTVECGLPEGGKIYSYSWEEDVI